MKRQEELNRKMSQKIKKLQDSWEVFKHSSANNGFFKGLYDAVKNYFN